MRIVHQSALYSYTLLLALPAPKIAGLLPARCASSAPPEPEAKPAAFTYTSPFLAELSAEKQGPGIEGHSGIFK